MIHSIYSPKLLGFAEKLGIQCDLNEALKLEDYESILRLQYGQVRCLKDLFVFYHRQHPYKEDTLGHLIKFICEGGIRRCLAIGSGPGVLEYRLFQEVRHLVLDGEFGLTTSDVTSFWWDKYYGKINDGKFFFDFERLDIRKVNEAAKIFDKQEMVISFGSFYIMNDKEFLNFLCMARDCGVKYVIDFHDGHLTGVGLVKVILKKIFPVFDKYRGAGQFHGYMRDSVHLRGIYKRAGFKIVGEMHSKAYTFSPVLKLA